MSEDTLRMNRLLTMQQVEEDCAKLAGPLAMYGYMHKFAKELLAELVAKTAELEQARREVEAERDKWREQAKLFAAQAQFDAALAEQGKK